MPVIAIADSSNQMKSRNGVICPGFPKSSLFQYSVNGNFEGEYNRICIVVDQADRVISIELVFENPPLSLRGANKGGTDWYCYNFVNYRVKALESLRISHEVKVRRDLIQMDTVLTSPSNSRVLESVRWFVPKPLAELILFCVNKGGGN